MNIIKDIEFNFSIRSWNIGLIISPAYDAVMVSLLWFTWKIEFIRKEDAMQTKQTPINPKSWTLIFNVLAGVVMVALAFGFGDFQPDSRVAEIAGIIISVINLILRLRPIPPQDEARGLR